jgi:hypothetical protein
MKPANDTVDTLSPWWLPAAVVMALGVASFEGILGVLVWFIGMVFHELGHAVAYWLSGRFAIPTFAYTMSLQESPSVFSVVVILGLILALGYFGWKYKHQPLLSVAALSVVLFVVLTGVLSSSSSEVVILYSGLGGELVLGTAAMMSAYVAMPDRFNWRINRFVFLGLGATSFAQAALRWYRAQSDVSQLPMGALLDFSGIFGGGESNGDLDRLIREFGWTQQYIVSVYSRTTVLCAAVLIGWFLYLLRPRSDRPSRPIKNSRVIKNSVLRQRPTAPRVE